MDLKLDEEDCRGLRHDFFLPRTFPRRPTSVRKVSIGVRRGVASGRSTTHPPPPSIFRHPQCFACSVCQAMRWSSVAFFGIGCA